MHTWPLPFLTVMGSYAPLRVRGLAGDHTNGLCHLSSDPSHVAMGGPQGHLVPLPREAYLSTPAPPPRPLVSPPVA